MSVPMWRKPRRGSTKYEVLLAALDSDERTARLCRTVVTVTICVVACAAVVAPAVKALLALL